MGVMVNARNIYNIYIYIYIQREKDREMYKDFFSPPPHFFLIIPGLEPPLDAVEVEHVSASAERYAEPILVIGGWTSLCAFGERRGGEGRGGEGRD